MIDEQNNTVIGLIQTAISQKDDLKVLLKTALLIFKSTEEETKAKKVISYLQNHEIMRTAGFLKSIKEDNETETLYYGADKGHRDPLGYHEKSEQLITTIEIEIISLLADTQREVIGGSIEL